LMLLKATPPIDLDAWIESVVEVEEPEYNSGASPFTVHDWIKGARDDYPIHTGILIHTSNGSHMMEPRYSTVVGVTSSNYP